ncbi:MAG: hypothetical protein MR443_02805 [Lachnospiraceae bacterium]|nr:hypothetical protein [Lachnospiraceae bacterium]
MFNKAKQKMMRGLSLAIAGILCVGVIPANVHAESTADHTQLTALIQEAQKLDVSSYSDETNAFFQAAIASAQETDANADATQEAVDAQAQLLIDTSKALVENPIRTPSTPVITP